MKACSKECEQHSNICDFCQYHEFRGVGYIDQGVIWRDAIYTNDGWCILHQVKKHPEESCSQFHCSNLKQLKANKNWITQPWLEKEIRAVQKKHKFKHVNMNLITKTKKQRSK